MTAEIIPLPRRASRAIAVRPKVTPDELISRAGDEWLAVVVKEFADNAIDTLRRTDRPLTPNVRRQLMRAAAAVRSEPEII